MKTLNPISVAANTTATITFSSPTIGMLIANESALSLNIDLAGYTRWLPAWTMDYVPFQSMQIVSGEAKVTPVSITSNGNPPSSDILVTLIEPGDKISGVYPVALTRQVSSTVTASSAFALLAPDSANMIYLDDTSIPGSLATIPSQAPAPTGLLDFILTARQNASTVQALLESDVANLRLNFTQKVGFELAGGIYIAGMQIVTGTGSGTFNHTLGVTPQLVQLTPTQAAEAYFVGSYTSTGFTVGGIGAGHQWKALVIA